jgi:hypothetical protein
MPGVNAASEKVLSGTRIQRSSLSWSNSSSGQHRDWRGRAGESVIDHRATARHGGSYQQLKDGSCAGSEPVSPWVGSWKFGTDNSDKAGASPPPRLRNNHVATMSQDPAHKSQKSNSHGNPIRIARTVERGFYPLHTACSTTGPAQPIQAGNPAIPHRQACLRQSITVPGRGPARTPVG